MRSHSKRDVEWVMIPEFNVDFVDGEEAFVFW